MASKEFVLQGFTPRTHADVIRKLFDTPDTERVVLSIAFVGDDGVRQIEDQLRSCADRVTIFAGIRNDITSHQALSRLHEIIGDRLYVVDTGSRNVIFHPKLYLVRGSAQAGLVLGSANLTLGGLNNNIEASMMMGFDLADDGDREVVNDIEAKISALPADHPENVLRVQAASELDELLASGRLVDERVALPPRPPSPAGAAARDDTVPRIRLVVPPLRRALRRARAPRTRPRTDQPPTPPTPAGTVAGSTPATPSAGMELVWESKPLTRRDLTIPDTDGTHATGSINLDKGLLSEDVDHRHYFREDVFPSLTWAARGPTVDEAHATFQLVLKSINYGDFNLRISHTTSTTSKAYEQKNAMTRLSWGPTRPYIAHADLIGRTLGLYRDRADPGRFVLEID